MIFSMEACPYSMAAATALLHLARSTPTEDALEEAARAAGVGGLPSGFVRLEARETPQEVGLHTFGIQSTHIGVSTLEPIE
jgi:hypothetical protein